ncbi:MAG: TolC family protein, partial [Chitinophagaceae bacterium]|nr:TolC family protein [Chitinophagaceae bacterium]
MRRFFLPILLLITLDSIAQKKLTLEEAIATALSNNFDIQLSRNDSIVAALNYGYRNAAFYPRLNANTGVVFNNNDQKQKFTDGTVRERNGVKSNNLTANLALNWTLFDGFRMFATRDKVAELVKLGELGIKEQLVNSVAAVINTYYNIVKQKQQLRAIEEQMSISQERVKLAQYKLDIGVGAKPDVLQSKVDLNAQKAAQLEQQTLIRQLKDQLSQLMNTAETNYDVSDSIPLNKGLVLTDIQSSLDKTNPALQVAQKNILIAGLTLKEIKADRFPVVGFTANYNFNKLDNKAVVNPFQPLNSRNKGFNYGLTATIPIFNNYNVKRQIQQAERDIVFRKLSMDNQKSQISLAVLNAWNNYQWQKQALDLEEESIVLAREN